MDDDDFPVTVRMVDIAKAETTRQTVMLVFSVVGTIATVYVAKKLQDQDTMSTLKMWTALTVKRWADKQADRFTRLALHMANVYNGEKL